jgi:serine/threonine protein phosphatase PrpC
MPFLLLSLYSCLKEVRMLADGDLLQAYLANVQRALHNHDVTYAQALLAHAQEFLQPSPLPSHAPMQLSVRVALDPGLRRQGRPNEDFVFAKVGTNTQMKTVYGLFVVADGMGGHVNGQMASRLATQTIVDFVFPILHREAVQPSDLSDLLTNAVGQANKAVYERNQQQGMDNARLIDLMGTTITVAVVFGTQVWIANVGDSRAYLYRPGSGLRVMTRDHSVVAELVARGDLVPEAIYTHPDRNRITRCLGAFPEIEVDLFCKSLQNGDILLLCTDGLWEMTRDSGIESILSTFSENTDKLLLQLALQGGGRDNIGFIVVQCQFDIAALETIISPPAVTTSLPS